MLILNKELKRQKKVLVSASGCVRVMPRYLYALTLHSNTEEGGKKKKIACLSRSSVRLDMSARSSVASVAVVGCGGSVG